MALATRRTNSDPRLLKKRNDAHDQHACYKWTFRENSSRHSPARLVSLAWGALQGFPARGCHSHCALTTEGRRLVVLIVLFSFLILLSPRFQFKNLALDENAFKHSDTILVCNSPPSDKFCPCQSFTRADLDGPL